MKVSLSAVALLLLSGALPVATAAQNCGCLCCNDRPKEAACCCFAASAAAAPAGKTSEPAARRHPLRGVITAVHADRSAIMVKHEAIPGVMRAMTMLFRVDEATLKTVKKGQAITALMSRQDDEWWLHDVKVVAEKQT